MPAASTSTLPCATRSRHGPGRHPAHDEGDHAGRTECRAEVAADVGAAEQAGEWRAGADLQPGCARCGRPREQCHRQHQHVVRTQRVDVGGRPPSRGKGAEAAAAEGEAGGGRVNGRRSTAPVERSMSTMSPRACMAPLREGRARADRAGRAGTLTGAARLAAQPAARAPPRARQPRNNGSLVQQRQSGRQFATTVIPFAGCCTARSPFLRYPALLDDRGGPHVGQVRSIPRRASEVRGCPGRLPVGRGHRLGVHSRPVSRTGRRPA